MSNTQLLELVPPWLILVAGVAIVMASIRGGVRLAQIQARPDGKEQDGPVGSVVGATLALLAFMLAFTFGIAANRRELRRDLLLEEVTAIGTTYLRAELIPDPHRTQARALLRSYVDLRLEGYDHPERLAEVIRESAQVQQQLWSHAVCLADAELKNPDIAALFVDSLSRMIELQTKRVTVGRYRIPTVVWIVFAGLTVLSMAAVGYQFGRSGRGSLQPHLVLAMCFSMVVYLIVDLDRAAEGWLRLSNQPMVELRTNME